MRSGRTTAENFGGRLIFGRPADADGGDGDGAGSVVTELVGVGVGEGVGSVCSVGDGACASDWLTDDEDRGDFVAGEDVAGEDVVDDSAGGGDAESKAGSSLNRIQSESNLPNVSATEAQHMVDGLSASYLHNIVASALFFPMILGIWRSNDFISSRRPFGRILGSIVGHLRSDRRYR